MVYLVTAAFLLDLLVGDPPFLPHPVVGIGRLVSFWESRLVRPGRSPAVQKAAGVLLAVLVTGTSAGLVFLVLLGARRLGRPFYLALQIYFIYAAVAARGLAAAGLRVRRALSAGDLAGARRLTAQVVGRDTRLLTEAGVSRAAVETVAENTVDAVVAPLFYAFIGGAVLAVAYRAVNTLDAMVGYKNERYRYLGWASARLDDLANWLPARLTGCLLVLAAFLTGRRPVRTLTTMLRFGSRHPSPNSGVAEAAFAGALGVRLGGPISYGGVPVDHPFLGDGPREPAAKDIPAAVALMVLTALLTLAAGWLVTRWLR
ncbi:MAG: adenosylcobinamide-phosphate synthase CbiB [Peptococcaceae bacterium]|jgi:adenosylcobinamide-phosphate synthase|nr:adenosylcobinamide-phosphate synthase CbiB [Peptococcaceae bacterium]